MDLITLAKETLAKQGAAGVPLALAALNGDKDEVIRLLLAPVEPPLLMPADEVTTLREMCQELQAQLSTEVARSKQLASQLENTIAERDQLREDFNATDNGWEELGSGLAKLLGCAWDGNEVLLKTVAKRLAQPVIRLERSDPPDALKSRISDLEAIIGSYAARELILQGEVKRLQSRE